MATFSRTWWGKRFIEALEDFSDSSRLGRGRSYAKNGKIKEYRIINNQITAKVRGSVNPYFGVYKEPLYTVKIEIQPISPAQWSKAIKAIASNASFVSKLLMNEVPDNINSAFADLKLHLLPDSRKDFKTSCSCPDYANPCKHIAGVYYLVAQQLDSDPFLLFELRGISREDLQQELAKTPLGEALSASLHETAIAPEPSESYYTQPERVPVNATADLKEFWMGSKRLPPPPPPPQPAIVPAILIKKAGDFPPFWQKDISFLEVMSDFYTRVKTKNKEVL